MNHLPVKFAKLTEITHDRLLNFNWKIKEDHTIHVEILICVELSNVMRFGQTICNLKCT